MLPPEIVYHLEDRGIPFTRHRHPLAVTAQEVAEALHVSGRRFAKVVMVRVGGHRTVMAVVPAHARLDALKLAKALGVRDVRMMREEEFAPLFPNCEPGAEPPFGSLYGMQVVVDESLATRDGTIFVRGGSHEETLELRYTDFEAIERPIVARITQDPAVAPWATLPATEAHPQP